MKNNDNHYCLVSSFVCLFWFYICSRSKALGDEFSFFLACLARLGLFQHFPTAQSFASTRLELSHVLTVTLDLFLLGIRSAGFKRSRAISSNTRHEGKLGRGKGLEVGEEGKMVCELDVTQTTLYPWIPSVLLLFSAWQSALAFYTDSDNTYHGRNDHKG
jgi:hypothetical protein